MKKQAVLLLIVLVVLGTAGFAGSAEARTRHRRTTTTTTTTKPAAPPATTPMPPATPPATTTATVTPPVTPPATPPATTTAPPSTTATATAPAPSATASGRWVGFYVPGVPSSMTALNTLQSQIGGHAAVVNFFVADTETFPTARCNNIVAAGATPLVTLEFWSTQTGGLATITNGSKDAYIKSFADSAKAFGKTVWLRPFHEMNGDWYPWGDTDANTSAQLVAAYRHVHDIFVAEGATNVKFVWCPNVDFNVSSYYPGDAYVDFAAIDGYNNGSPWRSFSNLFGSTYASVAAVTAKPIFIAETSCVEGGTGKAAWITDMFNQISSKYTRITGVCWFDASQTYDWRVDTSASSLNAFAAGVAKGF